MSAHHHSSIRLATGQPTPEELAAVLMLLLGPQAPAAPTFSRASEWPGSTRRHRRTIRPGPGAWRGSTLPHP
ncbi:acyl-CoA carboxylase subunit epsilon [Phycicoccus sp. Soil802]|uniref:acyl-CoA carboxylase subunit epsilon n=1 Tax=Phycicoccus sp. Soil802 TaxID=1736414 RepID=UPI0009E75FAE